MKALKNLFLNELAGMYDSEHRILNALPKIIQAATCESLQHSLQEHLEESRHHATQVEKVFDLFDEKPRTKKCEAMAGILNEGEQILNEYKKSPAINAAIISAWQKVEHYEIACYGTLRAWAEMLGNDVAVDILEEILDQEKTADQIFNDLSAEKNQEGLQEAEAGAARG